MGMAAFGCTRTDVQGSLQLAVGVVLVALTTVVRPITFPMACLGAIIFTLARLLIAFDNHLGTVIRASALIVGCQVVGPLLAGCMVRWLESSRGLVSASLELHRQPYIPLFVLSHAIVVMFHATFTGYQYAMQASIAVAAGPKARLPLMCVLGAIGLLPISAGRPTAKVPGLGIMSMCTCIWYGVIIIISVKYEDIRLVWTGAVCWVMLAGFVPAVAAVLVALLLMPSYASHELQDQTASIIKLLGHEISRCSSIIFASGDEVPDEEAQPDTLAFHSFQPHKSSKLRHFPDSRISPDSAVVVNVTPDPVFVPINETAHRRSGLLELLTCRSLGTHPSTPGNGILEEALLLGNRTPGVAEPGCGIEGKDDMAKSTAEHMHEVQEFLHDEPDDDAFLELLRQATRPLWEQASKVEANKQEAQLNALAQPLRMKLMRARELITASSSEPLILSGMSVEALGAWDPMLDAIGALITRVAALGGMVTQQGHLLSYPELETFFPGEQLAPRFKQVLAQLATSCANLGASISSGAASSTTHALHRRQGSAPPQFQPMADWSSQRAALRDLMFCSIDGFWGQVRSQAPKVPVRLLNAVKVRSLMFTWTLLDGIMQAVEALEQRVQAVEQAQLMSLHCMQCHRRPLDPLPQPPPQPLQPEPSTSCQGSSLAHRQAGHGDWEAGPSAHSQPAGAFCINLGAGPVPTGTGNPAQTVPVATAPVTQHCGQQGTGPAFLQCSFKQRLHAHLAWAPTLWPMLSNQALFAHAYQTLGPDLWALLTSSEARKATLRSRIFQAGVKYYCLITAALVAVVLATDLSDFFVRSTQLFAFITCCVVVYEKVEATLSRMVLRLIGAVSGATLGFVIMLKPQLAGRAWALCILLAASTVLLVPLASSTYRVAVVLHLYTLHAVILCQYEGSGRAGTPLYYAQRIISVSVGCAVPMVVSSIVLPWYVTTEALEQLSHCFHLAVELMSADYNSYYCALCAKVSVDDTNGSTNAVELNQQPSSMAVKQPPGRVSITDVELYQSDSVSVLEDDSTGDFEPPAAASTFASVTVKNSCQVSRNLDGGSKVAGLAAVAPVPSLLAPLGRARTTALVKALTDVQMSLAKEAVVWRQGPLSTPPFVKDVLAAQLLLADRLAALELAVDHTNDSLPSMFDGWALEHFAKPMHEEMVNMMSSLRQLAHCASAVMLEHARYRGCCSTNRAVAAAASHRSALLLHIETLEAKRVQIHALYRHLRARSYLVMKASAALASACGPHEESFCAAGLRQLSGEAAVARVMRLRQRGAQVVSVDHTGRDSVLFLSFIFAFTKGLDAAMVVAQSLAAPHPAPSPWLSWLQS